MNAKEDIEFDDDWLVIDARTRIPRSEFEFTFVRSSGPGGQNVNKVSSKACLRWPLISSESLDAGIKRRFLEKYGRRVSAEGDLLITSQRYRDRLRNVVDCLEKLREMIVTALKPPVTRKKVKPTRASRERRLRTKKDRSSRKESRRPPRMDD